MELIIKVNNQSNGRDKIARLIQYTSRLVWHQLETRNANKYSVDRVKHLEFTLSSFRKILRMGRCMDIGYSAFNTMHIDDPLIRYTLTTSKVATALYLYCDHIVWLAKSGFLKTDSDKWIQRANQFWLFGILANLLRDVYEIVHILELKKTSFLKPSKLLSDSLQKSSYESAKYFYAIVSCHQDVFIDTLKNSCDVFIPLTALGFTKLSPSTVGLLGAVSSLAALVTVFKPITKLVPA